MVGLGVCVWRGSECGGRGRNDWQTRGLFVFSRIRTARGKVCLEPLTRTAWGWLHVGHQRDSSRAAPGNLITGCEVRACGIDIAHVPLAHYAESATLLPGVTHPGDFCFRPGVWQLPEGKALWMPANQRALESCFKESGRFEIICEERSWKLWTLSCCLLISPLCSWVI